MSFTKITSHLIAKTAGERLYNNDLFMEKNLTLIIFTVLNIHTDSVPHSSTKLWHFLPYHNS